MIPPRLTAENFGDVRSSRRARDGKESIVDRQITTYQ